MSNSKLTVRDYFLFLVGSRQSILRIASSRSALLIGAIFVLSAGLAREYDGADLLHEPTKLLLPYAASIATSLAIFIVIWFASASRMTPPIPFFRGYRGFLAVYWATAPLAWAYAVPWERWLSPIESVRVNLTTLAVVSLLRVILIIRATVVLIQCRILFATSLVLTISALAVIFAGVSSPSPLYVMMAGIRAPDDELLLGGAALNAALLSCFSLPLVAIPLLFLLLQTGTWVFETPTTRPAGTSNALRVAAAASTLIWLAILPNTQPAQRLRFEAENATRQHRYADAVKVMAEHAPSEFPPHWRPPPSFANGFDEDELYGLARACIDHDAPAWLLRAIGDRILRVAQGHHFWEFQSPDSVHVLIDLARLDSAFCDGIAQHLPQEWSFPCGSPESQDGAECEALVEELKSAVLP